MYYTVGHTLSYEDNLKKHKEIGEPLLKQGRSKDYRGGIAFSTKEKAEYYLKLRNMEGRYSVYGLDTTKDNLHEFQGQTYIIEDCPIIRL